MTQPTPVHQRLESMDMLRGVAVLGILLININSFALPLEATFELSDVADRQPIDTWVYASVSALGQGKFMAMFALLFGAGVAMMVDRRRQLGEPTAGLHYRRIGVLAGLGFIHGVFIWHGDILLPYAICGALLYPLLLMTGRKLLWTCLAAWLLTLAATLGIGVLLAWAESAGGEAETSSRLFENEVELMRGGLLGIMKVRVVHWLLFLILGMFIMLPWVLALMTTGVLAKCSGWLTGERPQKDYRLLLALGVLIGLPVAVLRLGMEFWLDSVQALAFGSVMNVIDATALCLAWGAFVVLVCNMLASRWIGRAIIAVGRMALTNYLAQSVICTMLFYGYGFGLFGSLSRSSLLGVVAGVWLLQLLWSPWWLARHQRGPMEALWRRLTYPKLRGEQVQVPRES